MKKTLGLLLLLVLAIGIIPGLSAAECASTDVGTACADANGVSLDGNAGNEDPLDGYISVSSGGAFCASDDGGPGDDADKDGDCDIAF